MNDHPYVQTYTAVVGNRKCNAKCPYCVSKMTPCHVQNGTTKVNWRNFIKGAKLAKDWGASTFLITSKGEATLYPQIVFEFIRTGVTLGYSIIELQTNGLNLAQLERDGWLDKWYDAGLTTIAISAVHYDRKINQEIIAENYPELKDSVAILKKKDREFCVRLSVILIKGGIDSIGKAKDMIQQANYMGIDQLKLYPVNRPFETQNEKIAKWVDEHVPEESFLLGLQRLLNATCTVVRHLVHGDTIYSWKDKTMEKDQNVAYGSCLTEGNSRKQSNEIRQLIYCRDGHIRYSWQYNAAILF